MSKNKEREKDLQEIIELEKFSKSDVGKLIVKALNKEINDMMFKFVAELQNPNLNKYISLSCELKEKLELVKKITGAGDIRKVIEDSVE